MRGFLIMALLLLAVQLRANDVIITAEEFTTADGLPHRAITDIIQDENGLIWLSTWKGICSFDGRTFRSFTRPEVAGQRIDRIVSMGDGKICCKTYTEKQLVFDTRRETFTPYNMERGDLFAQLPSYTYSLEYRDNTLYIYNNIDKSCHTYPIGENKAMALGICAGMVDRQNNIWLHFNDRLYKISLQPRRVRKVTSPEPDTKNTFAGEVRVMKKDSMGRTWLACKDKRVYVYDSKDHLLGTIGENGQISRQMSQLADNVYSILQDKKGNMWIGTKGSGLYRFAATDNPMRFQPQHFQTEHSESSPNNDNIYYFVQESNSRFWIATYGGGLNQANVSKEGEVTFKACDKNSSLLDTKKGIRIRHLLKISQTELAASTTNGLLIYDKNGVCKQKIGSYNIISTCWGPDSLLYVCTIGEGLMRMKFVDGSWQIEPVVTKSNSAPDVVMSAVNDSLGRMWLVSDDELTAYHPATGSFESFGTEYFNTRLLFSEGAPMLTSNGDLRLGVSNGYVEVGIYNIHKCDSVSPVYVSEIRIDGKPLAEGNAADAITSICMKPDQRSISVDFATLDYISPNSIKYACSLIGRDSMLTELDNQGVVILSDLKPGKYKLRMKSTNSEGVWIDNDRYLEIVVEKSLLARYIWLIIFFIALILIYVKYRRRGNTEAPLPQIAQTDEPEEEPATAVDQKFEIVPEKPVIVTQEETFARSVMEFMEANMDNSSLTVDDIAVHLGCGRARFYKLMKDAFDVKPVDFIREMRIKKAAYLLRSRQYNISDVAYMTGFSDSKYFSKVFKKEFGQTPSEYMNGAEKED